MPFRPSYSRITARPGFTLVEMMVATAITLVMMTVVVAMFAVVSENIGDSRAEIEMAEQLRAVQTRLQIDLAGLTVTVDPPRRPEWGEGYFEYIEAADFYGANAPAFAVRVRGGEPVFIDPGSDEINDPNLFDSTLGDHDVLMFTTRSLDEPFVGRAGPGGQTAQSDVAEVRYFVRGRTLYRGQRLVRPNFTFPTGAAAFPDGYYAHYDIAVHQEGGRADVRVNSGNPRLVASTLGDLTKREYRFAHQPLKWPHDVRFWARLGLPTLAECSHRDWPMPLYGNVGFGELITPQPSGRFPVTNGLLTMTQITDSTTNVQKVFDAWENSPTNPDRGLFPWEQLDPVTGTLDSDPADPGAPYKGPRIGEDVIASNILSFDVKLWDPGAPIFEGADASGNLLALMPGDPGYQTAMNDGATVIDYGAYVDLGYAPNYSPANPGVPQPLLNHIGHPKSGLQSIDGMFVYDTGSFHYERDGINQDAGEDQLVDEGTNGIDDLDATGVSRFGIDDAGELEAPPPYPVPVNSMQIKIRMFEPDTRQIREVTIVHQFSP